MEIIYLWQTFSVSDDKKLIIFLKMKMKEKTKIKIMEEIPLEVVEGQIRVEGQFLRSFDMR